MEICACLGLNVERLDFRGSDLSLELKDESVDTFAPFSAALGPLFGDFSWKVTTVLLLRMCLLVPGAFLLWLIGERDPATSGEVLP